MRLNSLSPVPYMDLKGKSEKELLSKKFAELMLHYSGAPGHLLDVVKRRHLNLQEDIVFQEIMTHLHERNHLKRVDRLGSSELVQLRKSFQENCGRIKYQDVQGEVKNLEAEMQYLKLKGIEGDGHCQLYYAEIGDPVALSGRAATNMKDKKSQILKELHLETRLQLGDMEFERDWLENGDCQSSNGKRTSCELAMPRLDVKRRRNNIVDVN